MRFEILVQFIVPLTFLAIWALTSLLNRDAQPLPPRPGRPPGPGGVRPQNRAPGQAMQRLPGPGVPPRQPEAAAPASSGPRAGSTWVPCNPPASACPSARRSVKWTMRSSTSRASPSGAAPIVPPDSHRCREPLPHRRVRGPPVAASRAGAADRELPRADRPLRPGRSRRRIAHSRTRSTSRRPNTE